MFMLTRLRNVTRILQQTSRSVASISPFRRFASANASPWALRMRRMLRLALWTGVIYFGFSTFMWLSTYWKLWKKFGKVMTREGLTPNEREFQKHVQPHGEVVQLVPNRLWQVTGTMTGGLTRNMLVYRMNDGRLWLHSVVALDSVGMRQLETLGKLSVMVVPSKYHRLDAQAFLNLYPDLTVVCPREAKDKVREKVKRVCSDSETFFEDGSLGVHVAHIPGLKSSTTGELAYFLELGHGRLAMVVCDILFHDIEVPKSLLGKAIVHSLGDLGPLHMTRRKWLMLEDKAAFRDWLLKLSRNEGLPSSLANKQSALTGQYVIDLVCVAHGDVACPAHKWLKVAAESV